MMKKRLIPEMQDRRVGWAILLGVTFLWFALCRLLLLLPIPKGTGGSVAELLIMLLFFLFSVFYGYFALQMTGQVVLPILPFLFFLTLCRATDYSGILQAVPAPGVLPFLTAFLRSSVFSLRFGLMALAVGIFQKNLR